MREVTESAVWDVQLVSAFSKLTSDYSFAHGNSYMELGTDYTQRLSAFIIHILKMRLVGQNRLVS